MNSKEKLTPRILYNYLKRHSAGRFKTLDYIRICFRPFITPFHDILQLIPEGAKVLDIGCGNGAFLILISSFRNASSIAGLEIQDKVLEIAKRLLSYINNIEKKMELFDGSVLPVYLKEYNFVTLIDVLHHIPTNIQKEFLQEVFDKMGLGSVLIVKDIDADDKLRCYLNKLHDLIVNGEMGFELPMKRTVGILRQTGFIVESVLKKNIFVYSHFICVCRKI